MNKTNVNDFAEERAQDDGTVALHVERMLSGFYGVFADAVLIAEHMTQIESEAHCRRLRVQQALQ